MSKLGSYYIDVEGNLHPGDIAKSSDINHIQVHIKDALKNLLSDEKLDKAVKLDASTLPCIPCDLPFDKDSIVISTGIAYDDTTTKMLIKKHQEIGFKFVSAIYDFTPITVQQTHPEDRVAYYPTWLTDVYSFSLSLYFLETISLPHFKALDVLTDNPCSF